MYVSFSIIFRDIQSTVQYPCLASRSNESKDICQGSRGIQSNLGIVARLQWAITPAVSDQMETDYIFRQGIPFCSNQLAFLQNSDFWTSAWNTEALAFWNNLTNLMYASNKKPKHPKHSLSLSEQNPVQIAEYTIPWQRRWLNFNHPSLCRILCNINQNQKNCRESCSTTQLSRQHGARKYLKVSALQLLKISMIPVKYQWPRLQPISIQSAKDSQ